MGNCHETNIMSNIDDFTKLTKKHYHHSGGFFVHHSSSKTIRDFYHYHYLKDYSMSLNYKWLVHHSTAFSLPGELLAPSKELIVSAKLLPTVYDATAYAKFVKDFGTHYMSQAYMGGSAQLTSYFHECFLSQWSYHDVETASSSSFIGIYHDNSAKGWGSNISKTDWNIDSHVELKLQGGQAAQYGILNENNTFSPLDVLAWEESVFSNQDLMVPLSYQLDPISDLLQGHVDTVVIDNLNKSITELVGEVAAEDAALVQQ